LTVRFQAAERRIEGFNNFRQRNLALLHVGSSSSQKISGISRIKTCDPYIVGFNHTGL
jgi:hypothetical protein